LGFWISDLGLVVD